VLPSYAMIAGAVTNLVVLLGLTYLVSAVLPHLRRLPGSTRTLMLGLAFGVVAIGSMAMSFDPAPGVFVDLRGVAILGAAIFGGSWAAVIAALMAAAFRVWLGGLVWAGLVVILATLLLGVIVGSFWVRRAWPIGVGFQLLLGLVLASLLALPPVAAQLLDPVQAPQLWQISALIMPTAAIFDPLALLLLCQLLSREFRRLDDEEALQRSRADALRRSRELEIANRAYAEEVAGRQRTEQALRESEAMLSWAQRVARLGHWIWRPASGEHDWRGGSIYYSAAAAEVLGIEPGDAGMNNAEFLERCVHPDDRVIAAEAYARMVEARFHAYTLEYRVIRPDGAVRTVLEIAENVLGDDGLPIYTVGTLQDITDRKAAEVALKESEALKAAVLESALDAVIAVDEEGGVLEFNAAAERTFGVRRREMLGKSMLDLLIPERDRARYREEFAHVAAGGRGGLVGSRTEMSALRADGSEFPIEIALDATRIDRHTIFTACLRDITQRKRNEEALRESERMLQRAQRIAKLAHWVAVPDATYGATVSRYSEAAADIFGAPLAELDMTDESFIQRFVHPLDRAALLASYRRVMTELARTGRWHGGPSVEYRIQRPDGQVRFIREVSEAFYGDDGRLLHIMGTMQDITEQKRAETALRESEARFRNIADSIPALVWMSDADGECIFVNRRWTDYTGRAEEDELGHGFAENIHADQQARSAAVERALFTEQKMGTDEYQLRGKDGTYRWFLDTTVPRFDTDGTYLGHVGVLIDIDERRRLEDQLRQAQKMEAVGQLTGGIAHDFNNLLTVVLGNLDLIHAHAHNNPRVVTLAETALQAAERGVELVQRLLAFSRRQTLAPCEIALNDLVVGMADLLRHSLGDSIDVETRLAGDLWPALADPAQVENALLNLAINARDAMPDGGQLLIETANVSLGARDTAGDPDTAPGDYVLLSVTDTGIGMTGEVLERAVQPFFTTKEIGKGTGLGLSMIYGFAKQSGGQLKISSVVGKGSTIRLYLPRLHVEAGSEPSPGAQRRHVRSLDATGR
jgi:two-component system cell cycle sensor histidine kinase/response regulator CckA